MVRPLAGANPSNGQKNVENADAADHAAERGMEHDRPKQRVVAQKKVLFPIVGPWQIEQQSPHFEREHDQKCAIDPVHQCLETSPCLDSAWVSGWASEELRCARLRRGS